MSDLRYCIHGKLIAPAPEEMRCPHGCIRQASEAEIVGALAVETETPVFTQEEVHMIGGFLAEWWTVARDHDLVSLDIDHAIEAVLSRNVSGSSSPLTPRAGDATQVAKDGQLGSPSDSQPSNPREALVTMDELTRLRAIEAAARHLNRLWMAWQLGRLRGVKCWLHGGHTWDVTEWPEGARDEDCARCGVERGLFKLWLFWGIPGVRRLSGRVKHGSWA